MLKPNPNHSVNSVKKNNHATTTSMKPHNHFAIRLFQPSAFRFGKHVASFRTGFFLAAFSLQAFSLFAATGPSLDVFPHNNAAGEIATFKQGARLFSNRDLTLAETPAALNGMNFLRVPINGAEIRCTAPGEILVLTPTRGPGSLESTLLANGFAQDTRIGDFQLFGTGKNNRVLPHRKTLKAGDTLTLGKWSIVLGFARADFKRAEFDTSGGSTGDFNLAWHGDLKKLDDIPPVPGAEYATLYKADGTEPENMGAYSHHPHVCHHAGRLYAIWSNHLRDEDHPGQRVLIRQSADFGKTWQPALTERPDILFPSLDVWKKQGEPRLSNVNRAGIANGFAVVRGQLYAINEVERDGPGQEGDGRLVRRINDDGTFGDIFWLEPKAPRSQPGYPQYPGMSDPKYEKIGAEIREFLADKTRKNLPTWDLKGKRNTTTELDGGLPGSPEDGHSLCEPSKSYVTPDNILVNVWRDLHGPEVNNKRTKPSSMLYQSISRDGGENWSIPERTTFPNRNSLPCAGNLPDGTVYLLTNPASRKHLILSLSRDGRAFDRSWLVRRVDEPRRFASKYNGTNLAAAYQQAWVAGEWFFVIYSINKEDVEIARLPLKALK